MQLLSRILVFWLCKAYYACQRYHRHPGPSIGKSALLPYFPLRYEYIISVPFTISGHMTQTKRHLNNRLVETTDYRYTLRDGRKQRLLHFSYSGIAMYTGVDEDMISAWGQLLHLPANFLDYRSEISGSRETRSTDLLDCPVCKKSLSRIGLETLQQQSLPDASFKKYHPASTMSEIEPSLYPTLIQFTRNQSFSIPLPSYPPKSGRYVASDNNVLFIACWGYATGHESVSGLLSNPYRWL